MSCTWTWEYGLYSCLIDSLLIEYSIINLLKGKKRLEILNWINCNRDFKQSTVNKKHSYQLHVVWILLNVYTIQVLVFFPPYFLIQILQPWAELTWWILHKFASDWDYVVSSFSSSLWQFSILFLAKN